MPSPRESQPDDTLPQSDAPRTRSGFHAAKKHESGAVPAVGGTRPPFAEHVVDEPTPSLPHSWSHRLVEATRPTEQRTAARSVPVLANAPEAPPPLPPLPRLPPPPTVSFGPRTPETGLVPRPPDTVPSRRRASATETHRRSGPHPDDERLRLMLVFVLAFAIALVVASLTVAVIAVARGRRF